MRNIIQHNIRTSMNEWTHFFIKIYPSHFILERVNVGCVWEMSWRRGQTQQYFFLILAGLLNRGSTRAAKPSVCNLFSSWHLVPDRLQLARTASGTWLYNCLMSTCFRCSSAYLNRCISWLTARSRVNILQLKEI